VNELEVIRRRGHLNLTPFFFDPFFFLKESASARLARPELSYKGAQKLYGKDWSYPWG